MRAQYVCLILLLASTTGCRLFRSKQKAPKKEEPMKEDVAPIRNTDIKIIVYSNLTYNAKDEAAARGNLPKQVVNKLNELGEPDGNSFTIASGEQHNLTFNYTVNNDGNNRFTGSCKMSGWGWGYITTQYHGEYTFSNAPEMIDELTRKVYTYIHLGWHDSRKED